MSNLKCTKNHIHDFESNDDSLYCTYGCGVLVYIYNIELLESQNKILIEAVELIKEMILYANDEIYDVAQEALEQVRGIK